MRISMWTEEWLRLCDTGGGQQEKEEEEEEGEWHSAARRKPRRQVSPSFLPCRIADFWLGADAR